MTQTPSNANPLFSASIMSLYDPTSDYTDVAAQSMPAMLDSTDNIRYSALVTADQVRAMTMNKQAFSVSTGKIASSAVGVVGWQLFNNATAKNALLISLLLIFNSSNQHLVNLTAANANTITGWSGNDVVLTPVNNSAGGGTSLMTSSYTNANITGSLIGSTREVTGTQNNVPVEILTNGECILLPAGAASGVAIFVSSGAANPWSVTATYLEF